MQILFLFSCVVTMYSNVVGCQSFGGQCYLHLYPKDGTRYILEYYDL